MNVYIVLYRILGLPSLLDFLKKNRHKKTCESDGYMEISFFSTLIGKLNLVVQRALFCSSPASSSTTPPRLQGATSVRRRAWADGRVQLFFGTLCALFTRSQLGTYTENQEESREVWTMCEAHLLFIFISLNLWLPSAWKKTHLTKLAFFFPTKIPIEFDVARELTFPSLASLIACLSPEPGERSDVYSVSREISQPEILKTEGVGFFLLMECVV